MGNIQNKNNTVQKIYKGEQLLIDTSGGGLNNSFPQSTEVKEVELPIELQGVDITYYTYNDEIFVSSVTTAVYGLWKFNTTTSQWTKLVEDVRTYNCNFFEFNNKLYCGNIWTGFSTKKSLFLYNGNTFDMVYDEGYGWNLVYEYNGKGYITATSSGASALLGILVIDSNDNINLIHDRGFNFNIWYEYNGILYFSSNMLTSLSGIYSIDSNDNVTQIYDSSYDFRQSEILNDNIYFCGRNGTVKYSIIDNVSELIDTTQFYVSPIYKYKTTLFFLSGANFSQLSSDGNTLISISTTLSTSSINNFVEYTDPSNNKEYLLISKGSGTNGLYVCFADTLNTLQVWNSGYNFNYVFHYNGYNYITSSIGILEHDPIANTLTQVFTTDCRNINNSVEFNNILFLYGGGVVRVNSDRTFTSLEVWSGNYNITINKFNNQYFYGSSNFAYINDNNTTTKISGFSYTDTHYDLNDGNLYFVSKESTVSNIGYINENEPRVGKVLLQLNSNYDLYTDTTLNKNYFVCVKTDNSYLQVVDIENPTAIKGFVGGFEFNKYWFNQNGCTKFDESEGICYQYVTKYVPATAFNYIINQDNTIFYQILPNSLIYLVK